MSDETDAQQVQNSGKRGDAGSTGMDAGFALSLRPVMPGEVDRMDGL
ncbi:hypothetical protein IWQ55_003145 [Labrenzia sp. EL_208]|nr:hypothetical protein [Labrenzia sp. EL_132]MBG6229932.1 hypothetical protein [Labrenzia sp. EL_208]